MGVTATRSAVLNIKDDELPALRAGSHDLASLQGGCRLPSF